MTATVNEMEQSHDSNPGSLAFRAWVPNITNTTVDERWCLAQTFLLNVTPAFCDQVTSHGGWY